MTGTTISHYKVVSELGRGGMGVVYKAEDTKLNRTVALKVLSSHMLGSADDRARFYREARAAAALHHPNIATVFEIDEWDGSPFIAMEYIDGDSLDDYIARGPLALPEVIEIASQIAEALKVAHEKNIVHRDVKSANIKLTRDGTAKVLDFGLAKTAASTKLTQMGSTVGTVAYMSPEQARGQEVDQRSDIWSLGAVIYEMITGKLPFPGSYEQAVVYNILNTDPEPLTAVRTGVPIGLERIVAKCLSKDPKNRYQSTVEIPVDLRSLDLDRAAMTSGLSSVLTAPAQAEAPKTQSRSPYYWAVGGAVVGIALTAAVLTLMPRTTGGGGPVPHVRRLSLVLPETAPLSPVANAPLGVGRKALALTLDGRRLAYLTMQDDISRVAIRAIGEERVTVLEGTEGAYLPFFSPDGNWIGFLVENTVKKIAWTGGKPLVVAEVAGGAISAVWTGGQIVVSDNENGNLDVINVDAGTVRVVTRTDRRVHVDVLPDGETLLLSGSRGLSVLSLSNPQNERLLGLSGRAARYVDSGHVVFGLRGRLMIAPFNVDKLEFTGAPIPFVDNVRTEAVSISAQYAIAKDGTVVFVAGQAADLGDLVRVDNSGNEHDLGFDPDFFGAMQLSPDGTKLAIVINDPSEDIYVYDLERLSRTRLITGGTNQSPIWTIDGSAIVYSSRSESEVDRDSINIVPVSGGQSRLIYSSSERTGPASFSSDGQTLAFSLGNQVGFLDVQSGELIDSLAFDDNPALKWGAQFSRDSRYIAYTSRESGRSEVFVRRLGQGGRKWQISTEGGEEPIWSETGEALFFSNGRKWYTVSMTLDPPFSFGRPRVMFEGPYLNVPGMGYDVLPGGNEFVLVKEQEQSGVVTELRVIENAFGR